MKKWLGILTALIWVILSGCGQKQRTILTEVKGVESRITKLEKIGIMDTNLCQVRGQVTIQNYGNVYNYGSSIEMSNLETNSKIGIMTNSKGEYSAWIEPGIYQIEIHSMVTSNGLHNKIDPLSIDKIEFLSGEIKQLDVLLGFEKFYKFEKLN